LYIDILIDTFAYGAHSTATDGLKGGLPLLTSSSSSFPSRVGSSLLNNLHSPTNQDQHITNLFMCEGVKCVEDMAVKLSSSSSPTLSHLLRQDFIQLLRDTSPPLFDTIKYTKNFLKLSKAMIEFHKYHIII